MNLTQQRSIHRLAEPDYRASGPRGKIVLPTRKNPLIISASELRDWLRCRVKHHWRHQMRLVPKKGTEALSMGIFIHRILELWYGQIWKLRTVKSMAHIAKDVTRGTTPEELTLKDLQLIRAMCVGYAEWAIPRDRDIGLRKCTPEKWFALPLTKEKRIIVRGKLDNVFEPGELKRTIAFHEYKSKGQIKIDVVEMNLQLSVYLWALRNEFPTYRRFIAYYNVLRKQMPGPRVKAALFHREAVERTEEEIDQWAVDTENACLDMLNAAIYPNPMDSCSWDCDFRLPCLLRGDPRDLRNILRRDYKRKEDR